MPRRFTPLVNNFYYHVYNRGVNKKIIFSKKIDYIRATNLIHYYNFVDYPIKFSKFLQLHKDQRKEIWQRLSNTSNKLCEVVSYCLMPNHFHLLLKQNTNNGISKLLSNFQNGYARYFNTKYERVGPLFQGQFKAKLIEDEETLLHVSRYIHLNPYSSALIKNVKDISTYQWSSFAEYMEKSNSIISNKELILNLFGSSKDKYSDFVLNQADYQKDLENIKHLILE